MKLMTAMKQTLPCRRWRRNDRCAVTGAEVVQLMTRPPAHYTFATLIGAMMNAAAFVTDVALRKVLKDNAGLGTEATRAGIVEQLLNRHFIVRKGSKIMATELGADVIDALPPQLTEPGMTALWEQALDEVAAGRMSLDDFLQRQTGWTRNLVSQGTQQQVRIRVPPTPACPLCGEKPVCAGERKGNSGAASAGRNAKVSSTSGAPERNDRAGLSLLNQRRINPLYPIAGRCGLCYCDPGSEAAPRDCGFRQHLMHVLPEYSLAGPVHT